MPQSNEEMHRILLRKFDDPEGRAVLNWMRRRANKITLHAPGTPQMPNPAYMNRDAALYKAAILEMVDGIETIIDRKIEDDYTNEQKTTY